ncbi:methylmalonyl-CoA mutase subunit beta [Streptomyces sp. NBC_01336]|uniref:methylmalonyl-CoA mutase family protein n=1 Tax=Streptomyces sp. NBC_01336 TaxID=2903829 RepID=UPI002E165829|nr:methylmalonyl-CoA mutase subunit beta [Streptomyces sp. NBC_01336]
MTVLPDGGLPLAGDFPSASPEQWQALVRGVLRRAGEESADSTAEEALSTFVEDGIVTQPLYTADDAAPDPGFPGLAPFVRGARAAGNSVAGWDVRQRHTVSDNSAVLTDLENGVTSLWLVVGSEGIPATALNRVLGGVHLDLAPVTLDAGGETASASAELLRLYETRGVARGDARGNLGADPLGHEARTGEVLDLEMAVYLAQRCADTYPGLRALTVDALPYHEAGGSAAQELGCALATGVTYLRELTRTGLSLEQAASQLEFRYAATADQFLTIAKLRAARRLWARVAETCGIPHRGGQLQHAVTSSVMMTRRDPWVNMLRTTIATLSAGVGGADAVTVLPFDDALGLPDGFARRIARNTSAILMEESHLSRVIDPAGGSWYVESLTGQLAHAGWDFFQAIERTGGQRKAVRSGMVGEKLAATWSARARRLATREEPITGVSEFPHLAEDPVVRTPGHRSPTGGLPRVRRDDEFDVLRARSDAHLATTGSRPRIYLTGIGTVAEHTARLTFAANLFQAGGIEPVTGGRLAESGTRHVCMCGSDADYEAQAATVASELRSEGAEYVFLAGGPGKHPGIDAYLFAGDDAVAALSTALDRMEVPR